MADNIPGTEAPSRLSGAPRCPDLQGRLRNANRLSWKRMLKLLVCLLAMLWLVLFYVILPSGGGLRGPLRAHVLNSVIDLAAMLTLFLCVPRGWKYFLGPLFLLLAVWILWTLWHLRSLPWR